MYIIKDPQGDVYRKFLDIAFNNSDMFIVVVRKGMDVTNNLVSVIDKLKSSLIELKQQSEWPSTKLLRETASVYYYKADDNGRKVIKDCANSLFSWEQPELPEDLCFFKGGKAWISTCSHEGFADLYIEDKDLIDELKSIDGFVFED